MAFFVANIITQGVYTGIIGTISSATIYACDTVKSIYTHQNPDVNKKISGLDIESKIKLITLVAQKINSEYITDEHLSDIEKTRFFNMVKENVSNIKDPIEYCLYRIHEKIRDINTTLFEIEKKINNHNAKWFSTWRTLNVNDLMSRLETDTKILNARYNDLMAIINLIKK